MNPTEPPSPVVSASQLGLWARCLRSDHAAFVSAAKSYWYPVYAWLRRVGLGPERAGDAVKAAFTRWATFEMPRRSDEGAGLMREWLLLRISAMVQKGIKPGAKSVLEIDGAWAEQRYAKEPEGDADAIFLRRWAFTMVEFATDVVKAEYAAAGREELFAALLPFGGFEAGGESVEEVARRMEISVGGIRKEVFDFRKRFRAVLQGVVADTVADAAAVDGEIAELLTACDAVGEPDFAAPAPTVLGMVKPDQLFARAMDSIRLTSGGVGQWTPPTLEEVARLFPAFDSFEMIGCGGMGAVFRARQKALDRDIAIKLLPLEVSVEKAFAERFVREARAMAKLSHPNIAAVHDFGQTAEGHLFFVMDFVDGENLYEAIHRTGIEPKKVLHVVAQVCEALAYAHGKGVIHRDIKPANVLVGKDGSVKVVDFGLARLTDKKAADRAGGQATMTGMVMGTPDYMAPEQTQGMDVDHRADIYSLGVVLYEALVGEVPRGIFDLPSRRAKVDQRIDHIVSRAMHQQPDRRYQSASEIKAAVDALSKVVVAKPQPAVLAKTPVRPAQPVAKASPGKKRSPLNAILVGLVLVGAAVIFLLPKKEELTEAERKALAAKNAAPTPRPVPTPEPEPPIPGEIPEPEPVAAVPEPKPEPEKPLVPEKPKPVVAAPVPEPPMVETPAPGTPTPSVAGPDAEVAKWLAGEMEKYNGQFKAAVLEPFDAGIAKLREQYLGAVDRQIAAASAAGKLDTAIAWRNERVRVAAGQQPHEGAMDASLKDAIEPLRKTWESEYKKLDGERFAKAKALHLRFDSLLRQGQDGYTKRERFEDAVLLKNAREDIARDWLKPPLDFSSLAGAPAGADGEKPMPLATGPAISEREVIERVLKFSATVVLLRGNVRTRVTNLSELPQGRAAILEINVNGPKRPEADDFGKDEPDDEAAALNVSDADFADFPPLRELERITVNGRTLTGSGLAFLAGCPNLKFVRISSPMLTEAVFDPLLSLRNLEGMELVGGYGRPAGETFPPTKLAGLAAWPKLTRLECKIERLAGGDIPGIEKARNLARLDLYLPELSEEFLAKLGKLPHLASLGFFRTGKLPPTGLTALETAPDLKSLSFTNGADITRHLGSVGKMRKLENLVLDGDDATGLTAAAGAPALRRIEFSSYRPGSDAGLEAIAKSFPKLERLVVPGVRGKFTAAGVKSLAALQKLEHLVWRAEGITDEIVAALAGLVSVRELVVGETKPGAALTDAQLASIATMKELESLALFNVMMTPTVVDTLRPLRSLRVLDITSPKMKEADLLPLRRAMPRCKIVKK